MHVRGLSQEFCYIWKFYDHISWNYQKHNNISFDLCYCRSMQTGCLYLCLQIKTITFKLFDSRKSAQYRVSPERNPWYWVCIYTADWFEMHTVILWGEVSWYKSCMIIYSSCCKRPLGCKNVYFDLNSSISVSFFLTEY